MNIFGVKEVEMTETQFNDILQTMWHAGIHIDGLDITVHPDDWGTVLKFSSYIKKSDDMIVYDSDFGDVILRKQKRGRTTNSTTDSGR